MRRGVAFILVLLFSWMLVLPAFAASNAAIPLCCRKNGRHHCVMHATQPSDSGTALSTIAEKCPYFPHSSVGSQALFYTPRAADLISARLTDHRAVPHQIEANYRISHDRSRQKRGPPASVLS